VFIDCPHIFLKQLRHQLLGQPDGFTFQSALDARAAILRLVEDDFGFGQRLVTHGRASLLPDAASPHNLARGARASRWVGVMADVGI